MRPFRLATLCAVCLALALSGAPSEATPILMTVATAFGETSRIVDIPDDFQQGSFKLGVHLQSYWPHPDDQLQTWTRTNFDNTTTEFGSFENHPARVGFSLPSASQVSNPRWWEPFASSMWNHVEFHGVGAGHYLYTTSGRDEFSKSFSAKMSSASVGPYAERYGFDLNRDAPPFLLELMEHPERISIYMSSGSPRSGYNDLTEVRIMPPPAPVPTPEPTSLAIFGALLGGWLISRRRRGR